MEELKKYTNSSFMVPNLFNPVIFKCHWFDPEVTRRTYSNLRLVEIRHDSVLPGDDVYIVAQQAMQVYYLPYACQTNRPRKFYSCMVYIYLVSHMQSLLLCAESIDGIERSSCFSESFTKSVMILVVVDDTSIYNCG